MNLVIVESPTKARKLRSYLGNDFQVEASVGHIRDLPKKKMGVDIDHNFQPTYEVNPDKKDVISTLRKEAKSAKIIYLATDPDREGEAIAWHITHVLDGNKPNFKRATFHEITKSAVQAAIENPGELNMDLVNAQQARRIVDRLVGYEVSPVLWKKVRRGLSAGRVQSVALRLIVEREREIEAFVPDEYWEVDVALSVESNPPSQIFEKGKASESLPAGSLIARLIKINNHKFEPKKKQDLGDLDQILPQAKYVVSQVDRKERRRKSLPPFTTSTLQQAAANKLGMSSKQSMKLAQDLYEEGLITYHRTDSVNLSAGAIQDARKFIGDQFGDKYLPVQTRIFSNKSKNAQEAHEAIRVTDLHISDESVIDQAKRLTHRHAQLYDLIWRRFLASQMNEAIYDQTNLLIDAEVTSSQTGFKSAQFKSTGSVLKFDGWMKLFPNNGDSILPDVKTNHILNYVDHLLAQKFTQPPARYNDASLVKELEKRGIGRPSTYASIISVIEERGYVMRDDRKFKATPVGMTVSDFLLKHFPVFMEYEFTAEMEEDLDRISRGEKAWAKVVKAFYTPFHQKVVDAEAAERAQVPVEKTGEPCPLCGDTEKGEIVIRSGRFGKFKSCSRFPECEFTENIVDTIPGVKCPLCGKGEVISRNTRWGKKFFGCSTYPECDWASWKQPQPGDKISKTEWKKQQKARAERKKKREKSRKKKTKVKS